MTAINHNHFIRLVIAIIVSAIVWSVICSGCATEPKETAYEARLRLRKQEIKRELIIAMVEYFHDGGIPETLREERESRKRAIKEYEDANGVASNVTRGEN